jgi:hypothetical protein
MISEARARWIRWRNGGTIKPQIRDTHTSKVKAKAGRARVRTKLAEYEEGCMKRVTNGEFEDEGTIG